MATTAEQVQNALLNALHKFHKHYRVPEGTVQIKIQIRNGVLQYVSLVNHQPKHTLKLIDVIGDNFYNFIVERKLYTIVENLHSDVIIENDGPGKIGVWKWNGSVKGDKVDISKMF